MRNLFDIDLHDYPEDGVRSVRPSYRAIIIRDGKIYMVHSLKYDYYKFPGGGREEGESPIDTVIREVSEEAGLTVIPETVREFGRVHRVQKGLFEDIFDQENFYYLCTVTDGSTEQRLDSYEAEERFTLELVDPAVAIATNRTPDTSKDRSVMREREARVLEILIREGYFSETAK